MQFVRRASLLVVALALCFPATAHAIDLKSFFDKASKSLEENVGREVEETIDKVFGNEDEPAATQGRAPPAASEQGTQQRPSPEPQYSTAEVRETQRLLTKLGYNPGPIDGDYGSKTLRAILAFETDRGLPPTGVPSASLLATMRATTGEPSLAKSREHSLGTSTPSAAELPPDTGAAAAAVAGTSTPAPSSAAELGVQAGIPTWNGRLLVKGSSGISGIPTDDAITQMGDLAILLALKQSPDIVEDDQLAFAALDLLDESEQRQIITTAGLDAEGILGVPRYWQRLRLDEFERRALLQAIRAAMPALRGRAPGLPIPILVLCNVTFADYDFDSQYFPIGESARRCESMRMSVGGYGEADLGNLHALTIKAPLATEYLPDRVPVPLEDAEDYKRRNLQSIGPFEEVAVLAIEAQLVALKETESERNVRRFEFAVDLEGALLFRADDLSVPFDRLALTPPSSVATVGAAPTGPVPLDGETLNLMLLARDLVALDDADVAQWAAERANREAFGREGPWPRFFPKEVAKELPFGRKAAPLLLANFAEWNRARARALPETVVLATRTATLEWLQRDSQTGAVHAFDPPGSSRASTYRALAQRLGLPEARLVVPMGYDWSVRSQGLVGLGPVELVLVLPAARDEFRVALDHNVDSGGDFLEVSVAVRVDDLRIEGEAQPTLVVLDVEPVAARVTAGALGGAEVGSVAFDVPESGIGRGSAADEVEEAPSAALAEQAEAEKRAQQATEQHLATLLAGRNGLVMIRQAETAAIETVYADNSAQIGYTYIVRDNGLDLPAKPKVATTKRMAEALRDEPGVAIVLNASVFARDIFNRVADLDLQVSSFPPEEAPTLRQDHAASLASLVPGDARYVLLRRRDDQVPLTRVVAQGGGAGSAFYSSAMREAAPWPGHLEELGASITFELPEKAERVDLREIPAALRNESGTAVVLAREGLRSIFPKIADLDLVARRFPPEEFHVGIPKDHTEGAASFAILGVSGGLDEAAALAAISEAFASNEIAAAEPGTVRAARGACEVPEVSAAGTQDEVGAYCLAMRSTDGAISHVALRQVVPGNAEEAALKALREKYRSPFTTEIRHLDRGGKRIVLGWGAPLSVDRASLGRVDAKTPPTVLEAVVWVANDVTTVLLHLDDVTTLEEVEAAQTPQIRF